MLSPVSNTANAIRNAIHWQAFVSLDHQDKLGGGKQLPHQWTLEVRQDEKPARHGDDCTQFGGAVTRRVLSGPVQDQFRCEVGLQSG